MTGRALLIGAVLFVVGMAGAGAISYKMEQSVKGNIAALDKVAVIQGTQKFFATVKYPSTGTLPKRPVKVTLSLDNGPDIVTVTTPEAYNPEKFDVVWDTHKSPNGEHILMVKAYWGQQLIGQESRRVDISN